jgi:formiminotetrahydrofolate cyclodeaminase
MTMRFGSERLADLLASFQSPDPTPGGGSASALSGAVGASLLVMVAGLPKPRTKTDEHLQQLASARAQCLTISNRLTLLMDRDSEAYELVVAAFRLPKGSDEDKASRSSRIQEALRAATEAPLDVMRACAEAMDVAVIVAAMGNANASSDVQVALELLSAGLRGAKWNVAINLESIKDRAYTEGTRQEAERLEAGAETARTAAKARLQSG